MAAPSRDKVRDRSLRRHRVIRFPLLPRHRTHSPTLRPVHRERLQHLRSAVVTRKACTRARKSIRVCSTRGPDMHTGTASRTGMGTGTGTRLLMLTLGMWLRILRMRSCRSVGRAGLCSRLARCSRVGQPPRVITVLVLYKVERDPLRLRLPARPLLHTHPHPALPPLRRPSTSSSRAAKRMCLACHSVRSPPLMLTLLARTARYKVRASAMLSSNSSNNSARASLGTGRGVAGRSTDCRMVVAA